MPKKYKPVESHGPELFDWDTPFKEPRTILIINATGKRTYEYAVSKGEKPRTELRMAYCLAAINWSLSNQTAYSLEEISECFECVQNNGKLHFQQTKHPSKKSPRFFLDEYNNRGVKKGSFNTKSA